MLVLRDTLCSCEAYGMRPMCKRRKKKKKHSAHHQDRELPLFRHPVTPGEQGRAGRSNVRPGCGLALTRDVSLVAHTLMVRSREAVYMRPSPPHFTCSMELAWPCPAREQQHTPHNATHNLGTLSEPHICSWRGASGWGRLQAFGDGGGEMVANSRLTPHPRPPHSPQH
jgi:hypothetical protein